MAYIAQPVGFLADTVQRIYDYANEPADQAKWSTDKLYPLIRGAFSRCMDDVNSMAQNPIVVRHDITVTSTQRTYYLPCNVGQLLAFGKVDPQTGEFYETVLSRSRLNPVGAGVSFEGPLVRFEPQWSVSETLRVLYIPNGECQIHLGTFLASATGLSTTAFPISASPTEGYFDPRPNGYLGACVRLLSAVDGGGSAVYPSGYTHFPVQERPITAVTGTSRLATVDTAFDFNPASLTGGTITYEIVPFLGQMFQEAVAWEVASLIHGSERRMDSKRDAQQNRLMQLRSVRSKLNSYNSRTGTVMKNDLPGTGRYGWFVGL